MSDFPKNVKVPWIRSQHNTMYAISDADDITTSGSLQFDFKAIEAATCNFHESNKLGHGGFGEVYKA